MAQKWALKVGCVNSASSHMSVIIWLELVDGLLRSLTTWKEPVLFENASSAPLLKVINYVTYEHIVADARLHREILSGW